jgi:tetratricopeptide (TPR) repeat protein
MKIDDLSQKSIDGLSNGEALDHIGLLIDASNDARSSAGTDRAFSLLDEIRKRDLPPDLAALAHYFAANAWENRVHQKVQHDAWAWEQPEVQAQILELRGAVRHEGFAQLHVMRQCQILTNLANQLDHIGRFIEAVEFLDRALTLNGRFAMAHGNRGIALGAYARALYDGGHAGLMLMMAHDSLAAATSPDTLYDSDAQDAARAAFENCRMEILKHTAVEEIRKTIDLDDHSLGRGTAEHAYRTWCLEHRLFINPLNDLGVHAIAARDVLTLSSLTVTEPSAQVPPIIGFFNQMKQEFVSARYLYYEGVNGGRPHYSDREVLLYNTLDYPSYSIAAEKMRTAFRIAYSLLDKIAYFLNTYLGLGHKLNQVGFRSVWYEAKGAEPRPLLQHFSACHNWPLRGLFWLSKDIFEDDFRLVTEPDAEALKNVRDHLEHKYIQLHENWIGDAFSTEDAAQSQAVQFGLHLSRDDFAARALRVLKLVRAALIYLSLAVHREEWQRRRGQVEGLVMPMFLDTWQDSWKQ